MSLTLAAMVVALAVGAWMIILERRKPAPGRPRLLPTTPILFLSMVVLVLCLAHLVTLLTGTPHTGRLR